MNTHSPKIAIFMRDLDAGGIQKVVINLINDMAKRGLFPHLILSSNKNYFLNQVSNDIRIFNLNASSVLFSTLLLVKYLKKERPNILISHGHSNNIASVIAKIMSNIPVKLFLVEHTILSLEKLSLSKKLSFALINLMKLFYPLADVIIGVSKNTSRDLERELGLRSNSVQTIYNPVVDDNLLIRSQEVINHPWLKPNQPPIILTVGRLENVKNHRNLITAFAHLRQKISSRLIILGEGSLRNELETLVRELSIEDDVYMPGFVNNPYAYMSRSSVFVLSSDHEALPTVLIEAMACGCPVVSTDCPYGPGEILEDGKYGLLVSVNEPVALANAIMETLKHPTEKSLLINRANDFRVHTIVSQYLSIMGIETIL